MEREEEVELPEVSAEYLLGCLNELAKHSEKGGKIAVELYKLFTEEE